MEGNLLEETSLDVLAVSSKVSSSIDSVPYVLITVVSVDIPAVSSIVS